jgi:hypothetical protein
MKSFDEETLSPFAYPLAPAQKVIADLGDALAERPGESRAS